MEQLVILPAAEFIQVVEKLNGAVEALSNRRNSSEKDFVGNEEFMELMGISKRTAQTWRDEGVIAFSQIGGKIYYSIADINKLIQDRRCGTFDEPKRKGGKSCS